MIWYKFLLGNIKIIYEYIKWKKNNFNINPLSYLQSDEIS